MKMAIAVPSAFRAMRLVEIALLLAMVCLMLAQAC